MSAEGLAVAVLVALAVAVWLVWFARRRRTGIRGRVLYSDTGYERALAAPLVSERYGLTGKPDYLVEHAGGVAPIELKSAACPASGRPHDGHRYQVAVYCLLVEDVVGEPCPFGVIRYRDREVRVEFTNELRGAVLDLLEEMREAADLEDVARSHTQPQRCRRCAFRDVCDEALA